MICLAKLRRKLFKKNILSTNLMTKKGDYILDLDFITSWNDIWSKPYSSKR